VRPDVGLVLLDEPLTAVQPELKWRLRRTLRRVQADLGVTMVYVTHDQTEALTFASEVSVMHDGRILQTGSPTQVHDSPAHEYVGFFIGSPGMSFIDVEVRDARVQITGVDFADAAVPDGRYRLGFRADWGVLGEAGLPVELVGFRPDGMIDDAPVGVVSLVIGGVRAHVRHAGEMPSERTRLTLRRHVLFREGRRIA